MRLLCVSHEGDLSLTRDFIDDIPPYAILSHTWGRDDDEVTYAEMRDGKGREKAGFKKIRFCARQAREDGLKHLWVDTCCIDKQNAVELQEAITRMFRWYKASKRCYVYLADVFLGERNIVLDSSDDDLKPRKRRRQSRLSSSCQFHPEELHVALERDLRNSLWFTRGWTLQELVAPQIVEFYSSDEQFIGTKQSLLGLLHEITKIPLSVLSGAPLKQLSVQERMSWISSRITKRPEDKAYCMLGLFNVSMPLIYGEGERSASHRLRKSIDEMTGVADPVHAHWIVSPKPNPAFVGRLDIFNELQIIVAKAVHSSWNRSLCRIVISGIGGQGKSELCLQLASRLRQLFWAVIWIDMSTQQIAEAGFLDTAQRLSISAQDWRSVCGGMANLKQPWLLILDNADDPGSDYQDYFPDSRYGVVLMTTRNPECQHYGTDKSIVLEQLNDLDAQELLLRTANILPQDRSRYREDAQRIADLLSSHPLALIQAGTYIAQGRCSLAQYPDKYEHHRARLLQFHPRQAQPRHGNVYATFEVSAQMLKEMDTQASRDALELLPLLAVCEPNRLPLFLFEEAWHQAKQIPREREDNAEDVESLTLLTPWHVRRLPAACEMDSDIFDDHRLVEALSLLRAFALLSLSTNDMFQHVSLHPLVHAWARARQTNKQQQDSWLTMGCVFALTLALDEKLSSRQKKWMQPHIEVFLQWDFPETLLSQPTDLVIRILVRCGWYLLRQQRNEKSLAAVDKVMQALNIDLVKVDSQWRGLHVLRAASILTPERITEVMTIEKALVAIERQAQKGYGRLIAEYNLALTYQKNNQCQEATGLLEMIVQTLRNVDLQQDLFLDAQVALAELYRNSNRLEEAITILRSVVDLRTEHLPKDDISLLRSRHNLATLYAEDNQLKKAIDISQSVVEICEQILDESHPGLLNGRCFLASCSYRLGQVQEAVRMMEIVVDVQRRLLEEQHPDRLSSEHDLATYLWDLGRKDDGLILMSKVVKSRRQILLVDDTDLESSEIWLERMKGELGQLQEHESANSDVLKARSDISKL